MKLSRLGAFFLGLMCMGLFCFFALHFFGMRDGFLFRMKTIALVTSVISLFFLFIFPEDTKSIESRNQKRKVPGPKVRSRDIAMSTEDIQSLLNDMSEKTMKANDLILNRKIELQTQSSIDMSAFSKNPIEHGIFPKKEVENLDQLKQKVSKDLVEQTETGIRKIQEITGIHTIEEVEKTDPKRRAGPA